MSEKKEQKLSISESLMYTTSRIETVDSKGNNYSGTGFFYGVSSRKNPQMSSVWVITNKHVVEGMSRIILCFSVADNNGNPLNKEPYRCALDNIGDIVYHPDSNIDLCAIPVTMFIAAHKGLGHNVFYKVFCKDNIHNDERLRELDAIEKITMIGYPKGLWDAKHNLPLVRTGITSTPVYVDYNDKKEFIIDAACYPGSSGSPVLIIHNGSYSNKFGETYIGVQRLFLLGVLSSGPTATIYGDIEVKDYPEIKSPIQAKVKIPTNLGVVIKSSRILELEETIRKTLPDF